MNAQAKARSPSSVSSEASGSAAKASTAAGETREAGSEATTKPSVRLAACRTHLEVSVCAGAGARGVVGGEERSGAQLLGGRLTHHPQLVAEESLQLRQKGLAGVECCVAAEGGDDFGENAKDLQRALGEKTGELGKGRGEDRRGE